VSSRSRRAGSLSQFDLAALAVSVRRHLEDSDIARLNVALAFVMGLAD